MLPKKFGHIHQHLAKINAQVQEGKVPHARLILGKPGYGTLAIAIGHASFLLTGQEWDEQIWKCQHPDVHFTFPVVLASGISTSDDHIKEWRELLQETVLFDELDWVSTIADDANKSAIIGKDESARIMHKLNLKAYLGGKKIMVVWGADKMNTTTANKLLKLIEEPPEDTFIMLLAESTESILPTILSRCQSWRVPPIPLEEMAEVLSEEFSLDDQKARNLAAMSEGDFAAAKRYAIDHSDGAEFHPQFVTCMRAAYKKDLPALIDWSDGMHQLKRDKQMRFLRYSLNFFRQCMIGRYMGDDKALLFGGEKDFAAKFGKFVHGGNVIDMMELLDEAHYHIERNGSAKLIFLDLSVKIVRLLHRKEPYVQAV